MRLLGALLCAALLCALSACATPQAPTNAPANCAADAESAVEPPADFPRGLPLPRGLRLFKTNTLPGYTGSHQLLGYAPTTIVAAYKFLREELPKTGYVVTFGESEANEVELMFRGNEWQGAYRVNTVEHCAALTLWTINALKR